MTETSKKTSKSDSKEGKRAQKRQLSCVADKLSLRALSSLIKEVQVLCEAYDPNTTWGSYLKELYQKESLIVYVLKENERLVGFCFLDVLELDYGQLILYTKVPEDEVFFSSELMGLGLLEGRIVELIQFREGFQLRDAFIAAGCIEKERVKMVHPRLEKFEHFVMPAGFSMLPVTKETLDIAADISQKAHVLRHQEERYVNYHTQENRKAFSLGLKDPDKNNYIDEASCILYASQQHLGLVEAIYMTHQKEELPWIADLSIAPQYQGKKYGELLLQYCLSQFYKIGHSKAGLSVSIKNTAAYELYKKIGFEESEWMVELFIPEAG